MKILKFPLTFILTLFFFTLSIDDAKAWVIRFKGFGFDFCISNNDEACGKMSIAFGDNNNNSQIYLKKKMVSNDIIDITMDNNSQKAIVKTKSSKSGVKIKTQESSDLLLLEDIMIRNDRTGELVTLKTIINIYKNCKN